MLVHTPLKRNPNVEQGILEYEFFAIFFCVAPFTDQYVEVKAFDSAQKGCRRGPDLCNRIIASLD